MSSSQPVASRDHDEEMTVESTSITSNGNSSTPPNTANNNTTTTNNNSSNNNNNTNTNPEPSNPMRSSTASSINNSNPPGTSNNNSGALSGSFDDKDVAHPSDDEGTSSNSPNSLSNSHGNQGVESGSLAGPRPVRRHATPQGRLAALRRGASSNGQTKGPGSPRGALNTDSSPVLPGGPPRPFGAKSPLMHLGEDAGQTPTQTTSPWPTSLISPSHTPTQTPASLQSPAASQTVAPPAAGPNYLQPQLFHSHLSHLSLSQMSSTMSMCGYHSQERVRSTSPTTPPYQTSAWGPGPMAGITNFDRLLGSLRAEYGSLEAQLQTSVAENVALKHKQQGSSSQQFGIRSHSKNSTEEQTPKVIDDSLIKSAWDSQAMPPHFDSSSLSIGSMGNTPFASPTVGLSPRGPLRSSLMKQNSSVANSNSHASDGEVTKRRRANRGHIPRFSAGPTDSSVENLSSETNQRPSILAKRRKEKRRRAATVAGEERSLYERIKKLHKWFTGLDRDRCGYLTVKRLSNITKRVMGDSWFLQVNTITRIVQCIEECCQEASEDIIPELATSNITLDELIEAVQDLHVLDVDYLPNLEVENKETGPKLSFRLFVYLVLSEDVTEWVADDIQAQADQLRTALVRHSTDLLVAHYAHLVIPDEIEKTNPFLRALDAVSGLMILINGLTIGIGEDVDWGGMQWLEAVFTLFFTFELLTKMIVNGCKDTLFGPEWKWNWFDGVVVTLALFDFGVTRLQDGSAFGSVSFLRLARLARLTRLMRLLRVLRLRIFKELMLMVKGVIAGLRTLLWAIVLLMMIIYAISVFLRQTVGTEGIEIGDKYDTVLFDSVDSTMFMVFRLCLSDGSLPDGTPIVGHLYARYGALFMVPYMLCLLFIVFGIFNLITAVFVENVMESARQKRNLSLAGERVRVAQKLRELVLVLSCQTSPHLTRQTTRARIREKKKEYWKKLWSAINPMAESDTDNVFGAIRQSSKSTSSTNDYLQVEGQLTREMFQLAIRDPRVDELLDDLEVHIADRTELFDVLDADGSGTIDISELIAGLMKMRNGGADKSDAVATVLGIRALQGQMRDNQKAMKDLEIRVARSMGENIDETGSAGINSQEMID